MVLEASGRQPAVRPPVVLAGCEGWGYTHGSQPAAVCISLRRRRAEIREVRRRAGCRFLAQAAIRPPGLRVLSGSIASGAISRKIGPARALCFAADGGLR